MGAWRFRASHSRWRRSAFLERRPIALRLGSSESSWTMVSHRSNVMALIFAKMALCLLVSAVLGGDRRPRSHGNARRHGRRTLARGSWSRNGRGCRVGMPEAHACRRYLADASGATLPVPRDALPQLCPDDVPILGPWRGKEPSQGRGRNRLTALGV